MFFWVTHFSTMHGKRNVLPGHCRRDLWNSGISQGRLRDESRPSGGHRISSIMRLAVSAAMAGSGWVFPILKSALFWADCSVDAEWHTGRCPHRSSARNLVGDVLKFHRRMHFTSEFMTKVDGATMYYSLEARAPLLDHQIWEYAAKLPPTIHFHGGRMKAVLREIARRRVGSDVAFRRKQGFTIPVEKWLASKWSGRLKELKDDALLVRGGWMEAKALRAAVDEALSQGEVSKQLWHTLVFEQWLRRNCAMKQ
jgi:hypothetical protein